MILITVCRTLFYQFLLLFVGISIGFIINAEWVGWKYPIIQTSIQNTFFSIDFEDEGVLKWLYNQGQFKIFAFNGYPKDFKVIYLNDDVTTYEFVIESLVNIFNYEDEGAVDKAHEISDEGASIVAVLPFEIAEQKGVEVLMSARNQGYPLEVKLESN